MKFKEALYEVLDNVMPKENGQENVVSPQTSKILALMWNMLAVSKNVLDDTVAIGNNNNIISLQKSSTEKTTKTKPDKKVELPVEADEQPTTTTD